MSRDWEVLIVRHGQRTATRSDAYLNYEWYGEADGEHSLGYYFWILRRGTQVILVDTGFASGAAEARGREVIADPVELLNELGVGTSPDALIVTHGHYDHAGNVSRLNPQQAWMARLELEFWSGPLADRPLFAHFMEPNEIAELVRLKETGVLRLVDGATDIAEGVRLIPVGGHTPGQSVVEVQTRIGTVLLASDACHFHEELQRDMLFKSMTDWPTSYEVLDRIRSKSYAAVVSGHDSDELRRHPSIGGALGHLVSVVGGADEA